MGGWMLGRRNHTCNIVFLLVGELIASISFLREMLSRSGPSLFLWAPDGLLLSERILLPTHTYTHSLTHAHNTAISFNASAPFSFHLCEKDGKRWSR